MTDTDYAIAYKLRRGMGQLQILRRRIDRFLNAKANRVVNDFDAEPGYLIVRAIYPGPPPQTCSALIGEFLYHGRAALDYMACELARRNNQIVDDHVEWPIFCDAAKFRNPTSGNFTDAITNRIGLIAPKYQAVIEDEQPFQGRYGQPEDDPLAMLYVLSNYDRHQFIHLTSVATNASFHDFMPPEAATRFEKISVSYGAFKGQAEVARFRILDGPKLNVEVQSNIRLDVAFGDGGPLAGRPVLNTLGAVGVRVGEVMQRILAVP
jgi:hypothetical protein